MLWEVIKYDFSALNSKKKDAKSKHIFMAYYISRYANHQFQIKEQ